MATAAVSERTQPNVAVSMVDHEDASAKAEAYSEARHVTNITLNRVLEQKPGFRKALENNPELRGMDMEELMRRHGDTVHIMAYLNSHNEATRSSIKRMGIPDPDEHLAGLIDSKDLAAAAFVDAAVASWMLKNTTPDDLIMRDDWPPANVTQDFAKNKMKAHIGDNHGVVPSVEAILNMHPTLQEYQIQLFANMLTGNHVIGLHTQQDIENLMAIGDYLCIPSEQRAVTYKRYLMPPSFTEFKAEQMDGSKPAPFLEKAVGEGKIIAQVVERLDPIKDDLTAASHFGEMVKQLAGSDEGKEMLRNLRIGWVGRPARFPEGWDSKTLYDDYSAQVEQALLEVNELYKQTMETEDDFVLIHRDEQGKMSGYPHDQLKTEVYPYSDITFQVGQEGLCQTIQEGVLTRTFGLEVPQPAATVVSKRVGFAEKAQENGLSNTHVVEDMNGPEDFIAAFTAAYKQAVAIRQNPGADEVAQIKQQLRTYYDTLCKDSFYETALETLVNAGIRLP